MREAASTQAALTGCPSDRFRSASSDTTMAPSTSMPATRIRLNSTTILSVRPMLQITRMPVRNAPGMVSPTSTAERGPMAAITTMITSTMAVSTLLSRSERISRTSSDWSMMKRISRVSGNRGRASSIRVRICSMVSIMLAPERLETSSTRAGSPLMRAKPVGSLKVRCSMATSPKVTTVSPSTFTGIDITSSMVSITPGTFSAIRPLPVSSEPAATSWLFRVTREAN